jgi:small subunit ribosomal protein S19
MSEKYLNKFQRLRIRRLKTKYIDINLLKNVNNYFLDSKKMFKIKTQSRASAILPCFNKLTVYIYNGKKYIPFEINSDFFGHKFGELAKTRTFIIHKKQTKRLVFTKKTIVKEQSFKHTRLNSVYFDILLKKNEYLSSIDDTIDDNETIVSSIDDNEIIQTEKEILII